MIVPTSTQATPGSQRIRQLLETTYQERNLVRVPAGQVIPQPQDEVWIVCRGVVTLSTTYESGDEALLGLVGPGMPFGRDLSLVDPYYAAALTPVDLMRLKWVEIEQSPSLARELMRAVSHRLRQSEALLALAGQRRVEDRLREFLGLLGQEFGLSTPQGTRLGVRLTHQHLANALGTTRVTVTRLLGQFRQEGWLSVDAERHLLLHR